MIARHFAAFALLALVPACKSDAPAPDLGRIYNEAAQNTADDRNPLVVIPGVLGSKLEHVPEDGERRVAWGAFVRGAVDADYAEGARVIALPMQPGRRLDELTDAVRPTTVLDRLTVDVALVGRLNLGAYVDILMSLAVGEYRDATLGGSGAVDYGGAHYTCFQHAYDWRRDMATEAAALHAQILDARRIAGERRGLPKEAWPKVDVVAHSMGGLLLRYYLRFGPEPLPEDGGVPAPTWRGAEHVDNAILVGTPNAGSLRVLERLLDGVNAHPFGPFYRPPILGTMPALYQLLPRTRHVPAVDADTSDPIDLFDVDVWEQRGWGLFNKKYSRALRWLLPEVASAEARRAIARDHVGKCLAKAQQFHAAIDQAAEAPDGLELTLFCGDAMDTPLVVEVDEDGDYRTREMAPGDDQVARSSAIMDERVGRPFEPRVKTPIDWDHVQFLNEDHIGLTKSAVFTDNLLYLLLEAPRP